MPRIFLIVGLFFACFLESRAERTIDAQGSAAAIASSEFRPRSGPAGSTLFKLMAPGETGVNVINHYDDPAMWGAKYYEYLVGAIGTGGTVGDYDNDGLPDIFVVNKTSGGRLFKNLGNWKFTDVTEKSGLALPSTPTRVWSQGATFADVNNDGLLDLYICRFSAPNLLYINQGDGTFKEEAAKRGLAVVDACGMAAFCDYDKDGWLDVFIQTNLLDVSKSPDGQANYLFHNNGDGTFFNVTTRAGISGLAHGHSATWWDYDGDGWPDLYVANDFAQPDALYHNNHDGTFTNSLNETLPCTPYSAMGADLGDVDNDGRLDLLVGEMATRTVPDDLRGMADFRARGKGTNTREGAAPQLLRNTLFLNTGTHRCLEAAHIAGLAATDWTWSVRFEDLDEDGRVDLYVTNGMNREQTNVDLLAKTIAAPNVGERARVMKASPILAQQHLAFRNLGDLQFDDVSKLWGLDQIGVGFGAAYADFDGDGDLDLVYVSMDANVTLLRNDTAAGNRVIFRLRGTRSNRFGVGATVQIETASGIQVRQSVLARGYLSSSEPILHFGVGQDSMLRKVRVEWPSGEVQEFNDLPANHLYTITEADEPAPRAWSAKLASTKPQFTDVSEQLPPNLAQLEDSVDETNEQPLLPFRMHQRGPSVAVGRLESAPAENIIIAATSRSFPKVLRLGRDKVVRQTAISGLPDRRPTDDGPILIFDLNGDGKEDIILSTGGANLPAADSNYRLRVYTNEGTGHFEEDPTAFPAEFLPNVGAMVGADFNHDGQVDLFVGARLAPNRYPTSPSSALLINHGGKFEDVTAKVAPELAKIGMVTAALWTDVDRDGWVDLLVATEWGGITYWHNEHGTALLDKSKEVHFDRAGTGWWTSMAAADFNGDGRLDYVVGNVGLNTPYSASKHHPALLYYGEFDDESGPQIIEARWSGEQLFPWRSRRELGGVIRGLLHKYSSNDLFSVTPLPKLLGEERLASAEKFSATELRSGVFTSQSDGTYQFEPLPTMAQIAPIQGLVAADLDGDGKDDILAAENLYSPVPAIGSFAGGLGQFLKGDGRGNFEAVPLGTSGISISGDAKALVLIDVNGDGWPDVFGTRNNAAPIMFTNAPVEGRDYLDVHLIGPSGNLTAAGSRVAVYAADDTVQVSEVSLGSGYSSQASGTLYFGYEKTNKPVRIEIHWMNGTTTMHKITDPWPRVIEIPFKP